MQPRARSIFDLFDGKKRYEVPLFQRQYVWSQDKHWERLWDDVQCKLMKRMSDQDGPPHFLGAMVLDQQRFYGDQVPTHLVIDGQQRLTTFQIFLSAFRDVCKEMGVMQFADECQRYIINTGVMENEDTEKYKVWPTKLDRKYFVDIIESGSIHELKNRYPQVKKKYKQKYEPLPLMIDCYKYFYNCITDFIKDETKDENVTRTIAKIHETLRSSLQVVTIELEGEDDPQVIFETLNALGEPLLPSDLLRNFIFWRAAKNNENQNNLYERYWLPFDEQFWKETESQGKYYRPRSDIFLQHYLSLHKLEEVNIGHLFAEYRYWINNDKPFDTVENELIDMEINRNNFKLLIQPEKGTGLGVLANTLKAFEIKTIYPLILGLLNKEIPEEELTGIFMDLESFIVRRAVCNYTPKNYNRLFISILSKLPKTDITRSVVRGILLEGKGDSVEWPRDEVFNKYWLENPVRDKLGPTRTNIILNKIEDKIHNTLTENIDINSPLTIEHILPDHWIEHWLLPNGSKGVDYYAYWDDTRTKEDIKHSQFRDILKHTIGNLTLLTQPLNSTVSNLKYEDKKPEIISNSALALNRYFQNIDEWNEDQILKRGEHLFEYAKVIWPYGN
jgi:uncharacterized protein with ParB-like and HNH nuclease domain